MTCGAPGIWLGCKQIDRNTDREIGRQTVGLTGKQIVRSMHRLIYYSEILIQLKTDRQTNMQKTEGIQPDKTRDKNILYFNMLLGL